MPYPRWTGSEGRGDVSRSVNRLTGGSMEQQWRPTPGQVVLVVPSGTDDRYTGIVGSVDDKTIEITLSRPIEGMTKSGATAEVEARFITPSAMYRLSSKAKVHSGKGGRISLGRAETLERVQRRRFPRVQATLPVAVAGLSPQARALLRPQRVTHRLSGRRAH